MSDMKCPICGEMLQKYGEVDPDTGTSIVLGANCPKCGIGDSDIKLWQELITTRKALDKATHRLMQIAYLNMSEHGIGSNGMMIDWCKTVAHEALKEIKELTKGDK